MTSLSLENTVTYARIFDEENETKDNEITSFYAQRKFLEFIRNYNQQKIFIYRNQLRNNYSIGQYFIQVQLEDLSAFDEKLATEFINHPAHYLPLFEAATKEAAASFKTDPFEQTPDFQVTFSWNAVPMDIRKLSANHVSKLICLAGIIIKTSRTCAKATHAHIQCMYCKNEKTIPVRSGYSSIALPKKCDGIKIGDQQCKPDPYVIIADKCKFIDQQSMKLQELPEMVPTGEMPRSILLTCDRYLVERAPPGTRVTICGIFSTFDVGRAKEHQSASIRYPYVQVVGIQVYNDGLGRINMSFSKQEEEMFKKMAKDPKIYQKIAHSIDPAIFGHENIKKAIACQLFGASSKLLPDGIRRRGDINILLLGDPSTAKSQLLKFTEKVAPIGVYTSGKGSSAAGLTACIIKEPGSGEYYLEGGSLVLADGGIVCIDEFDKMRDQDRVAIHEAMEQQTISIAKAGITTVLNSRTAVLAAANPHFGHYDDLRSASEQIDFQSTILSRFDMIFIVKDVKDSKRDEQIARHVLNIHMTRKVTVPQGDLDIDLLKRYIAYCRSRVSPRLSKEANEVLLNYYVKTRSTHKSKHGMPIIPITVRQLEALIRISEALARMQLSPIATKEHAEEAIRLFTASTIDAINSGLAGELTPELAQQIQKAEMEIKKRLPIKALTNYESLCTILIKQGIPKFVIDKAAIIMQQRDEIGFKNQRAVIFRKK